MNIWKVVPKKNGYIKKALSCLRSPFIYVGGGNKFSQGSIKLTNVFYKDQ